MTVCPAFDFAYRRALLRRSGTDVGRYRGGDYSTTAAKEPRTFYSEATHELDQILESVTVFTARRGAKGSEFQLPGQKSRHLYQNLGTLQNLKQFLLKLLLQFHILKRVASLFFR